MNRRLLIPLLLFFISGCVTEPVKISHYNLPGFDEIESEEQPRQDESIPVLLTLQTASYLSTPGIVYQTSELEVESAYGHRWAEALPAQLKRILETAFDRADRNFRVVDREPVDAEKGYQLNVEVDRFQGRYDGKAVIAGSWSVKSFSGNYIGFQRFNIETPLQRDGYPALVESLNKGWQQVCKQMVSGLQLQ